MKRVALLFVVACTFFVLLPTSAVMAVYPNCEVMYQKVSVVRNHYVNLYWDWLHTPGIPPQIIVHTKIKVVSSSDKVVRAWAGDVLSDNGQTNHVMNLLHFKCPWKKGKYRIQFWGVDADGDRAIQYPKVVGLTIK